MHNEDVTPVSAFIAVGANLGAKIENCRSGIRDLTSSGTTSLIAQSPFYRTSPVGFEEQDWFVNAVVKVETHLRPFALLDTLLAIQERYGGKPGPHRFGPRYLDLDILFFDDQVIRSQRLTVPHPRMAKRRFVLQPLCDIDPNIVHPVYRQPVAHLLAALGDRQQQIVKL